MTVVACRRNPARRQCTLGRRRKRLWPLDSGPCIFLAMVSWGFRLTTGPPLKSVLIRQRHRRAWSHSGDVSFSILASGGSPSFFYFLYTNMNCSANLCSTGLLLSGVPLRICEVAGKVLLNQGRKVV